MENKIKFSVVIPTRERSDTLKYTIMTVLSQTYRDFELVIMDNFSQDHTREVVSGFQDERIKYYCAEKRLSMMDNWELALSHVNGEYLIYIGDDDALIPECLMICDQMLKGFPGIKAVKWNNDSYCYWWPSAIVEKNRNMLLLKFKNEFTVIDSHVFLSFFCKGGLQEYPLLPTVYHGLVQTELVKNIQKKSGKYFMTSAVDIYSGIVNAYSLDKYILSNYSFSITGISGKSNGTAQLFKSNTGKDIRDESKNEYNVKNLSELFHPELKGTELYSPIMVALDSLLQFKELFSLTNDQKFAVNKVNILNVMINSIKFDYEGYENAVLEIKALAKKWNIKETELHVPPKAQMERPIPGPTFNASGNITGIIIDAYILGISNINDATKVINSMTSKKLVFKKEGIQIG